MIAVPTAASADDVPHITAKATYTITLDMSECGTMYLGTVGTCIVSLQTWMNWATGSKIRISGVYDEELRQAVMTFQRKQTGYKFRNIAHDGHVAEVTREALRNWYDRATSHGRHAPCGPGIKAGCDYGQAIPGLGLGDKGKIAKSVFCAVVSDKFRSPWSMATGIACDILAD
ncbi:peptidoglycan-binding domain-containing protein [Nonomuraea sp. CA-143628]|uniref:peptidoglycan-binding domain-containing protein n=1 Tax=Nonomuraea sp. CA-143628 TaxID=3239997 RepID=UPI003D93F08D